MYEYTTYFHYSPEQCLGVFLFREGELVEAGQIVGTVGETGIATGPHLHWFVTLPPKFSLSLSLSLSSSFSNLHAAQSCP